MRKIIVLISLLLIISTIPISAQTTDPASTPTSVPERSVENLIQEGIELHDEGEYEEAIDRYNEALDIDSTQFFAVYEIALSYLALKDYENASLYSSQVIDSKDKQLSPGAYAVLSEALAGLDQVDDAIEVLNEGIEENGDIALLYFNLALNYYKKGDIEKTIEHVTKAIDLDKSHSGAFLLYAYALNDKGLWVQSILPLQMFLLLEPDSKRSKDAFNELLQTMQIKKSEEPVERSFIQRQLMKNVNETVLHPSKIPPLSTENGLNRNFVYHAITSTMDSLNNVSDEFDDFTIFKTVNLEIIKVLERESKGNLDEKEGVFWTFYIPFFSLIAQSTYYDTYCRYISVSYIPESLVWWEQNPDEAVNFVMWFENGDEI